jgi:hypothetical protein
MITNKKRWLVLIECLLSEESKTRILESNYATNHPQTNKHVGGLHCAIKTWGGGVDVMLHEFLHFDPKCT